MMKRGFVMTRSEEAEVQRTSASMQAVVQGFEGSASPVICRYPSHPGEGEGVADPVPDAVTRAVGEPGARLVKMDPIGRDRKTKNATRRGVPAHATDGGRRSRIQTVRAAEVPCRHARIGLAEEADDLRVRESPLRRSAPSPRLDSKTEALLTMGRTSPGSVIG
jgi:hypothetical protein